jgi:hypothetical protein
MLMPVAASIDLGRYHQSDMVEIAMISRISTITIISATRSPVHMEIANREPLSHRDRVW